MNLRLIFIVAFTFLLSALGVVAENTALYFPPSDDDWQSVEPESAGWDPTALNAALDFAGKSNSTGIVILHNGRILAERYYPAANRSDRYQRMLTNTTPDARTIEDVASVQKSVISFLTALARERADLKLTDRVSNYLDVGWSKTHRDREHEITLHQIMTMTSGLNTRLDFQFDPAAYWRYNTNAYAKMLPVLQVATGKDIHTLTREWLTEPTGMSESSWAPRPWVQGGLDANSIGFATSARDLARFGLLILNKGNWNGNALIKDTSLIDEMFRSSQNLNPAYGLLWWLNGKEKFLSSSRGKGEGSMIPTAPDDMVAALGALGRKCYIVPSLNLVVTRLGDDPGPTFDRKFWKLLMQAAPSS